MSRLLYCSLSPLWLLRCVDLHGCGGERAAEDWDVCGGESMERVVAAMEEAGEVVAGRMADSERVIDRASMRSAEERFSKKDDDIRLQNNDNKDFCVRDGRPPV